MRELKWSVAKKYLQTGLVFLVFTTTWCPDCKMMEPVIKDVEQEIRNEKIDIEFIKVDAEEANLFRKEDKKFKVLKVPSLFIVKNGSVDHIGYEYLPKEIIIDKIKTKLAE